MKMSTLDIDRDHKVFSKRIIKHYGISGVEDYRSDLYQKFIPSHREALTKQGFENAEAQGFSVAEASIIRNIALKKYHSIYVFDDAVVDFIKNSSISEKEMEEMYDVVVNVSEEWRDSGLVVHMKGEDRSVLYSMSPEPFLFRNDKMTPGDAVSGTALFFKRFCENEPADVGYLSITEDGGIVGGKLVVEEKGIEEWKIFFNLCLYMNAFPDCVKDGAPPIQVKGSRERSKTIRASKQIRDVYRDGVSPHMRRGHFRFLKSERYRKKRFQAVYVKPTMVRGHAITVTENPE